MAKYLVGIIVDCKCGKTMYYDLAKNKHSCRYCGTEKKIIKEPEYKNGV